MSALKKFDFSTELNKHLPWLFMFLCALVFMSKTIGIGYNLSYSLPNKVYLVNKLDRNIERGQLIAFRYAGELYPHGTEMGKVVVGVPGDVVTEENRNFYINGTFVGRAKETSLDFNPLELSHFRGKIPPGKFWFATEHVDGFDSRYAMAGLGDNGDVIGRIIPLF